MTIDTSAIRHIEDLSLNAWPSHMIELYDGWLIRFSHNYTYRTNSVEQVNASTIPIADKVRYCEEVYKGFGSPCSFKISPLLDPSFDSFLADRDYQIRHVTEVMTADTNHLHLLSPSEEGYDFENRLSLPHYVEYSNPRHAAGSGSADSITVTLQSEITDEWIAGVFHLNGTSDPTLRRIVPSMFKAIPKETIAASIEIDGRMVASGLGIRDRNYIGLYAIYVSPGCRRRGYARAICSTLLAQGKALGSTGAYLQVVKGNVSAKSLYHSLGFDDFYTYWFRSKACESL